jgi:hypothetical protein
VQERDQASVEVTLRITDKNIFAIQRTLLFHFVRVKKVTKPLWVGRQGIRRKYS